MDSRHLVAFGLIALLIVAGLAVRIYAKRHSRDELLRRDRERSRERRKERAAK